MLDTPPNLEKSHARIKIIKCPIKSPVLPLQTIDLAYPMPKLAMTLITGCGPGLENHVARIVFEAFWKRQICGVPWVQGC